MGPTIQRLRSAPYRSSNLEGLPLPLPLSNLLSQKKKTSGGQARGPQSGFPRSSSPPELLPKDVGSASKQVFKKRSVFLGGSQCTQANLKSHAQMGRQASNFMFLRPTGLWNRFFKQPPVAPLRSRC